MQEIARRNLPVERIELSDGELREHFAANPYKIEILGCSGDNWLGGKNFDQDLSIGLIEKHFKNHEDERVELETISRAIFSPVFPAPISNNFLRSLSLLNVVSSELL